MFQMPLLVHFIVFGDKTLEIFQILQNLQKISPRKKISSPEYASDIHKSEYQSWPGSLPTVDTHF